MAMSSPAGTSGGFGCARGSWGCAGLAPAYGDLGASGDSMQQNLVQQALRILGGISAQAAVARVEKGGDLKVRISKDLTINLAKWPFIGILRKMASTEGATGTPVSGSQPSTTTTISGGGTKGGVTLQRSPAATPEQMARHVSDPSSRKYDPTSPYYDPLLDSSVTFPDGSSVTFPDGATGGSQGVKIAVIGGGLLLLGVLAKARGLI